MNSTTEIIRHGSTRDTLVLCPKCNGSGRIEPDESGYDGCDLCNYGDGPTGFVPDERGTK